MPKLTEWKFTISTDLNLSDKELATICESLAELRDTVEDIVKRRLNDLFPGQLKLKGEC